MIAAVDHKGKSVWGLGNNEEEAKQNAEKQLKIKPHFKLQQALKFEHCKVKNAEKYTGDDLYKLMNFSQKTTDSPQLILI